MGIAYAPPILRQTISEMIETLRQEWNSEMSWEQVFTLRDRLDAMLEEIRTSRNIGPPSMWCPVCNQRTQQAPPSVSVRATILALGRFGIVAAAEMKSLEKRWAKHRKENSLDRNGKSTQAVMTRSTPEGSSPHLHSATSKRTLDVALEHELQRTEPISGGSTHDPCES
jgi:hypothetical protein